MPELRKLNRLYDDSARIPTLVEVIDLVRQQSAAAGLYIELKHPTYFCCEGRYLDGQLIGFDMGAALLDVLVTEDFVAPADVYIQSFEVDSLLALQRQLTARALALPLVQLVGDIDNVNYRAQPYDMVYYARLGDDLRARYGALVDLISGGITSNVSYAELATPAVLAQMAATYASGIGPPKQNLLPIRPAAALDPDGDGLALQRAELTGEVGIIVNAALAAGLELHPYTLRAEEPFLVRDGQHVLPVAEEAVRLLQAGATGFFIDQPGEGRVAVEAFLRLAPAQIE
jgi:glycerophosphoryl diester phosphodiesterase